MRTHKTEFPDCEMPAEILEALKSGLITDESWHNDVCPSFTRADGKGELWIDYEDETQREFPEWPRFRAYTSQGEYTLYEGDSLDAAIETLLNFDKIPS